MKLFSLSAFALTLCLCLGGRVSAQAALLTPTYQFSKQKTSYITLKNGKELEGNVRDFDRKRGITDYIKLKATDGKTYKLEASKIAHAYLHPSSFSSMASFFDDLDVQRWDKDLHEELFKDGYVYLETTRLKMGKKVVEVLIQVLNPHFSEGIRIYFDPNASESAGVALGPVKLVGGLAKSYYVKKEGESVATLLRKNEYGKIFAEFYEGCEQVMAFGKPKWKDFAQHAFLYSTECAASTAR